LFFFFLFLGVLGFSPAGGGGGGGHPAVRYSAPVNNITHSEFSSIIIGFIVLYCRQHAYFVVG
jgi:hypothetical protein